MIRNSLLFTIKIMIIKINRIHHIEVITFAHFELGPIQLESLLVKETSP